MTATPHLQNMPPKYEQYESLVDGYEKHPDQGLKATKKKLNKDPNNAVLLVCLIYTS